MHWEQSSGVSWPSGLRLVTSMASSDWPAWVANSWQVFWRGTPVWPCADLVIYLPGAVGHQRHAKSLKKELQPYFPWFWAVVSIKLPQRWLPPTQCIIIHSAFFGYNIRCGDLCHVLSNRSECCFVLTAAVWLLLPPLYCSNPYLNGLSQWVRCAEGQPGLLWKWSGPAHLAQPCPTSQTKIFTIMTRLELKFAVWDQIFGSLVEKVHSLASVNTGFSGP